MRVEYIDIHLSTIIEHFIKCVLTKKGWKVIAIDPSKNMVVFQRFAEDEGE